MVEFVMPSAEEVTEQLEAFRRHLRAYFDEQGWTPGARDLDDRMERLIYKYKDQ